MDGFKCIGRDEVANSRKCLRSHLRFHVHRMRDEHGSFQSAQKAKYLVKHNILVSVYLNIYGIRAYAK